MYKHIDRKEFRRQVETLLTKSVSADYVGELLEVEFIDKDNDLISVFDSIVEDVEETSGWREDGYYNTDDIKLAIGRTLLYAICN